MVVNALKSKAQRWQQMIENITICRNDSDQNKVIETLLHQRPAAAHILSFVNANAANHMWLDEAFYHWFMDSDVILRDGSGILLLMQMLNFDPGINLNGSDFIPKLLERASLDQKIAIYGTREPFLSQAKTKLQKMGYQSIETTDGFQDDDVYLSAHLNNRPEIVLLAMGMPKQNRIASLLKKHAANSSTLIINGGGIIDFISQRHSRAPLWMRKYGLEWLFRFINEPLRLWRRNLIEKPLFLWRSIIVKLSIARNPE